MIRLFLFSVLAILGTSIVAADDILIADFEGETYPDGWTAEGTAFGTGPAKGTLPNQMRVSGFLGKGLVNSYLGGDGAKGKLTSSVFKIERPFLSFLIGGGGHEGLAVNLLIDGKAVRTATGPNVVPGGSETLNWTDWDIAEFQGKEARIEIVDDIGGSWGHINVDHIVQSDRQRKPVEKRIDLAIEKEFLHIPITMSAPTTWIRVETDGRWTQEFDCPLTVSGTPDFYANLQIGPWKGKFLTLIAEQVPQESRGLEMLKQDERFSHEETVYKEKYRPQFHFTTRTGWINDPNGLVFYKGIWHLFTQHNPYGTKWGNMTWGHATSPDLLHWTEHPDAIHPDKLGTIYSGSGVVDWNNSSGFQKGEEKPIVLIYSASGGNARFGAKMTQCVAYSTDAGKTFTKYEGNPVLPHIVGGNRDPKVIWHEPSGQWVMALYMDKEDYALFGSKNLKGWKKLCDIKNLRCTECPDFFPLPVDGDISKTKWVFWSGNGKYLLGSFDGKEFKRDSEEPLLNKYGGNDYAAMTYSDAPNGRRIQFSWMSGGRYPDMPFNQQYTVPRELTLRTTPGGVRLFTEPVKELESLRGECKESRNLEIKGQTETVLEFPWDLFDSELLIDLGAARKLTLKIGETIESRIVYSKEEKQISLDGIVAPLDLKDNMLKLRIVVDRTSIELFAQDGEVQIAKCFVPKEGVGIRPIGFTFFCEGENATVESVKVWRMNSVWNR